MVDRHLSSPELLLFGTPDCPNLKTLDLMEPLRDLVPTRSR